MIRFIVDLELDGYDNEEEMAKACEIFIYDQLEMTASSVKVKRVEEFTVGGDKVNVEVIKFIQLSQKEMDKIKTKLLIIQKQCALLGNFTKSILPTDCWTYKLLFNISKKIIKYERNIWESAAKKLGYKNYQKLCSAGYEFFLDYETSKIIMYKSEARAKDKGLVIE